MFLPSIHPQCAKTQGTVRLDKVNNAHHQRPSTGGCLTDGGATTHPVTERRWLGGKFLTEPRVLYNSSTRSRSHAKISQPNQWQIGFPPDSVLPTVLSSVNKWAHALSPSQWCSRLFGVPVCCAVQSLWSHHQFQCHPSIDPITRK